MLFTAMTHCARAAGRLTIWILLVFQIDAPADAVFFQHKPDFRVAGMAESGQVLLAVVVFVSVHVVCPHVARRSARDAPLEFLLGHSGTRPSSFLPVSDLADWFEFARRLELIFLAGQL